MNDNTAKLIEQLAQKLGTTSEYLWSVLLYQAHIDAAVELGWLVFLVVASVTMIVVFTRMVKSGNHIDDDDEPTLRFFATIVPSVLIWFTTLISLGDIKSIINGFYHPDFWALNYILDKLN